MGRPQRVGSSANLNLAPTRRRAHVALLRRLRPVEVQSRYRPDFGRKRYMRVISMLAAAATAIVITSEALAEDARVVDLATWTPPSIGSVGDDPFGKLVKYGYALFT